MLKKKIAIIPARGGSKRIPRKNIRDFLGKPIISYTIETAIASGLFDEVMVSTDDEEIARVACDYGANIPFFRSEQNANDHATLVDVLIEVVNKYETQGLFFDYICCLLPTAPLMNSEDLIKGYNRLYLEKYDSVCPVVAFSYPILRALELNDAGYLRMKWAEYAKTRSQDLRAAYHDSGTFYWINKDVLLIEKTLFAARGTAIVLDECSVQDIDTEKDWQLAELKYKLKKQRG